MIDHFSRIKNGDVSNKIGIGKSIIQAYQDKELILYDSLAYYDFLNEFGNYAFQLENYELANYINSYQIELYTLKDQIAELIISKLNIVITSVMMGSEKKAEIQFNDMIEMIRPKLKNRFDTIYSAFIQSSISIMDYEELLPISRKIFEFLIENGNYNYPDLYLERCQDVHDKSIDFHRSNENLKGELLCNWYLVKELTNYLSDTLVDKDYPKEYLDQFRNFQITAVQNYGNNLIDNGNVHEAMEYRRLAVELAMDMHGETSHKSLIMMYNYGKQLMKQRSYDSALSVLKHCERMREAYHMPASNEGVFLEYMKVINNIAECYIKLQNYERATESYGKVIRLKGEFYGESSEQYLRSINRLVEVFISTRQFQRAEPLLLKSIEITASPNITDPHGRLDAEILKSKIHYAHFYSEQGHFELAEYYLKELVNGLKYASNSSTETIKSFVYHDLGFVYLQKFNHTLDSAYLLKADTYFEISLRVRRGNSEVNLAVEDRLALSATLNNYAMVLLKLEDIERARNYAEEAYEIRKKLVGEMHYSIASILNTKAQLEAYNGELDKAVDLEHQAYEICKRSNQVDTLLYLSNEIKYKFQNYLNEGYEASDDLDRSIKLGYELLKFRMTQSFFQLEEERTAYLASLYSLYQVICMYTIQNFDREELSQILFNTLNLFSNDYLKFQKLSNKLLNSSPDFKEELAIYNSVNEKLKSEKVGSYEFDSLERSYLIVKKRIQQKALEYTSLDFHEIGFSDLKRSLDGRSLVYFFEIKDDVSLTDTYYALVFDGVNTQPQLKPLFYDTEIKEIIDPVLLDPTYETINHLYKGASLDSLIWQRLSDNVNFKNEILYIPSGLIHYISFPAIHADAKGPLVKTHKFLRISGIDELNSNNKISWNQDLNAYLIGSIDHKVINEKARWTDLKDSKVEIAGIKQLLEKEISVNELIGDVGEDDIKSINNMASIVHFAVHGFFMDSKESHIQNILTDRSDNYMSKSGLILSDANHFWNDGNFNINDDDGILTSKEMSDMYFGEANLIVLSSCNSGLSVIDGINNLYGLQKALKIAGGEHIILTLWEVASEETTEFMLNFYSNLIKSKSITGAFYETQDTMSGKYGPYVWGSFVLIN